MPPYPLKSTYDTGEAALLMSKMDHALTSVCKL